MKTRVAILLAIWFVIAAAVVASGVLATAQPPTVQIAIAIEILVLLAFYTASRDFAEFARSIPLSRLTFFHLWRLLPGTGFLLLYHRGLLPHDFAIPAGFGDIGIALLASVFAFVATRDTSAARKSVLVFHLLGLLDLMMVVSNAARLALADPVSMRTLAQAPLVIVPIFFVPLTMFIHIVAIDRCRRMLRAEPKVIGQPSR